MQTFKVLFGKHCQVLAVNETTNKISEGESQYYDLGSDMTIPDFLLVKADHADEARRQGQEFIDAWKTRLEDQKTAGAANDASAFQDKGYVLITGGSEGIGLELAKLFAADQYNLALVARGQDALSAAADMLRQSGVDVITLSRDLFDIQNAHAIYSELQSRGIKVDILVNDAGQGEYGKFEDNDLDRELAIIELNICSVVVLTKLFLRDMIARGSGRILNLASIAGKVPGPYQAVYHGTKAFVHSFTEAVRSEVEDTGVTLTSLLPGATDTDFFNKAGMQESKVVQGGKLGDAASVAKDGYEALMAGKDMVISGIQNKIQAAISNILPDSTVANTMRKQQEPGQ